MRCKTCDYPLWGVLTRQCPECGAAFDLWDYWFEPGTVVFRCPYCRHAHEGVTGRGMPFDAGKCLGCGQMLVVEQMSVEPKDGSDMVEPREGPGGMPPRPTAADWQRYYRGTLIVIIVAAVMAVGWLIVKLLGLP